MSPGKTFFWPLILRKHDFICLVVLLKFSQNLRDPLLILAFFLGPNYHFYKPVQAKLCLNCFKDSLLSASQLIKEDVLASLCQTL